MTEPFIGIDFGTCNSSAAWFNPRTRQAEVLTNAEGEDKTPSVIYFGPNDETVVGRQAEERLENPEGRKRVLIAVKRDLAKPSARFVGDRRVTPLDAAAFILGKIRWDAEQGHFQEPVTRAVITCPAVFTEVQRDKLREAAALAGFRTVELLEEPVAAAEAYAQGSTKVGRTVLVYDLGGGTFDLALLAREAGEEEFRLAMPPQGEPIGGEDFDRAIYDHFESLVFKKVEEPICPNGLDLHLLRQCRRLKESLSASEQTDPLTWYWPGKGALTLPSLKRESFENLIDKHVERTVRLTRVIQQDAAKDGYALESLILIGGASRTPCIKQRLQATLQVEPRKWQKQDVAVALGAAYYAQRLWGAKPSVSGPQPKESVRPKTIIPAPEIHEVPPANEKTPNSSCSVANGRKQPEKAESGAARGAGERRPCPLCGEMIMVAAVKCRFCGELFEPALQRKQRQQKSQEEERKRQQREAELAERQQKSQEEERKQQQREMEEAAAKEKLRKQEQGQRKPNRVLQGLKTLAALVLVVVLLGMSIAICVALIAVSGPFAFIFITGALFGIRTICDKLGLTRFIKSTLLPGFDD